MDAEWRFAEEVGQLFERMGGSRMAGRVWGLLTVADEDLVSAGEMAERLQASSGSISTATRLLTQLGLIDRVRQPGDRKDYFRTRPGGMDRLMHQRLALIESAVRLADRGIAEFGDREKARPRLEQMRDFYAWYARELPALHRRWEEEQGPEHEEWEREWRAVEAGQGD